MTMLRKRCRIGVYYTPRSSLSCEEYSGLYTAILSDSVQQQVCTCIQVKPDREIISGRCLITPSRYESSLTITVALHTSLNPSPDPLSFSSAQDRNLRAIHFDSQVRASLQNRSLTLYVEHQLLLPQRFACGSDLRATRTTFVVPNPLCFIVSDQAEHQSTSNRSTLLESQTIARTKVPDLTKQSVPSTSSQISLTNWDPASIPNPSCHTSAEIGRLKDFRADFRTGSQVIILNMALCPGVALAFSLHRRLLDMGPSISAVS